MKKKGTCPLTGLEAEIEKSTNYINYSYSLLKKNLEIFVCSSCNLQFSFENQYIFKGLIANGFFPTRVFISKKECNKIPPPNSEIIVLDEFLLTQYYPQKPNEKLENLLQILYKKQMVDGRYIILDNKEIFEIITKGYYKDELELDFYLKSLHKIGYISYFEEITKSNYVNFQFTIDGLQKIIELNEDGVNSKNCFIAMSFDKEMKPCRDAIKRALIRANYKPDLIDEKNINSDKTIPDAILNSIRNSKFCIADFSQHKNGVYFEAGYALGLGKPVIYCCHEDEFKKSHFDIKQLQHIIYKDEAELEEKLFQKIEAWIK